MRMVTEVTVEQILFGHLGDRRLTGETGLCVFPGVREIGRRYMKVNNNFLNISAAVCSTITQSTPKLIDGLYIEAKVSVITTT